MKKKYLLILGMLPIAGFIIWGSIKLASNKIDPLWNNLEKLIFSNNYYYIEDKIPELDSAFRNVQRDTSLYHISSYDLISEPFPLTMEYRKFINAVDFLYANKRMLVLGVTGSGRSTMLDRLSKFLAVDPDRILTLSCVPKLEVEYHKQWIGYVDNGVFYKGKLLQFMEEARADSLHNYVMIIDDIDLIYPNTFFGADIWNELENENYEHVIEGYDNSITLPDNFFLITTTKTGPGSIIKFNDEHYRRLSPNGVLEVYPDSVEFMLYLKRKFADTTPQFANENIRKCLYSFIQLNNIIKNQFGRGYTLGQWSTIRKSVNPEDYDEFVNKFVLHVNALNPEAFFDEKSVKEVVYSANNNGIIRRTNFYARIYDFFYQSGIFSEASVAIIFLLISSVFGYIFYVRRRNIIRGYVLRVYRISEAFENAEINYKSAIKEIQEIRTEVDHLAMQKKINYTESLFIYNLIRDRSAMMSESKETEEVYNRMFETFMEDNMISEKEFEKLSRVIERSRNKISENYYQELRKKLQLIKPI
jgi:hypothetical protein